MVFVELREFTGSREFEIPGFGSWQTFYFIPLKGGRAVGAIAAHIDDFLGVANPMPCPRRVAYWRIALGM